MQICFGPKSMRRLVYYFMICTAAAGSSIRAASYVSSDIS
jgi:hypothetical protein